MSNLWNGRLVRRVGALALALLLLMPANLVSMLAETLTEETGEGVLICALAEHAHTEDCYEDVLVCGEEARDPVTETVKVYVGALKPHVHTDECRDRDGKLICGIVEKEYYHEHNEYCRNEAGELVCGLEERKPHKHTDHCYADKQTLVCNIAESEGHQHTDACYTERSVLTCQLAESEGHQHTDACYTDRVDLICQIAENDGHVHTDACYTRTLVCDQEEGEAHQHTDACYEDVLSCNLEVGAGAHKHGDACYAVTRELTCGQEAGAGAHKHGEGCYTVTRELTCGQEVGAGAHKHGEGCYETKRELICTEGEPVVIDGVTFKIETLTSKASDWTTEEKTVDAGHTHTEACYERRLTCDKQEHTHTAECFAPAVKAGSASTGATENDDPDETTEEESAGNEAADEGQSEEDGDENADADAGEGDDANTDAETDENTKENNDDAENSGDADVADDADANDDADADTESDENTEENNNDDVENSAGTDVADDANKNNDADADAETDENTEENNDDAENSGDADMADDTDENNDADADVETDENANGASEPDKDADENINDDAENCGDKAEEKAEADHNTNDNAKNSDNAEATGDADADTADDSDAADDANATLTDGEEQAEAGPAEGTVSAADAAVVEATATDLGLERTETPADTNGTVTDATGAERRVFARSDYFGLDISVDEEAVARDADGLFRVAVTLDAPVPTGVEGAVVDDVSAELYHVADGAAEKVKDATFEFDADNALTGFAFTTASCSPFIVAYTARYHFDIQNYSYDIRGAQDVALSDILSALEIPADAAFYAGVEAISVSDEEILSLTEAEGEWALRALKEPEGPVYLAIRMADGRDYSIDLAPTGVTELVSENEVAVITAVNDLYLPEDETVYAEITEAGQEHEAVSAVQEQNETTDETSAYQVISVGVENVDAESYEGFEVAVNLEQNLVGTDFQLYQVQDGVATDITDTLALTSETNDDGVEDVTGFTFTTEEFTEYVLCYSLQAFYTTFDGYTFQITLDAGPEAKIPYGAELKVSEILPEEADYGRYLEDSAAQLGVASEAVTFARFFDIQIEYNGDKVEPQAPVQVKIAYQDALPMDETSTLNVVHFADAGTEVIADVAVAEDNTEITYAQDSFSVTGTIVTNGQQQSGKAYVIVVKDEANNKYYAVQNDGSLLEVVYNEGNNTVQPTIEVDYPFMWTYESISTPSGQAFCIDAHVDAARYDPNTQLPIGSFYRYISPVIDEGIYDENKLEKPAANASWWELQQFDNAVSEQHSKDQKKNALIYQDNMIHGIGENNNMYLGADFDALHIRGKKSADDAAKVYLASIMAVPNWSSNNETVSHIDIAIEGNARLDFPLENGPYYNASGEEILNVTSTSPVTLLLTEEVDITEKDIMGASVEAFDKNGNKVPNAFYITGYSANQQSSYSPVQVRMEGSFKVDTLPAWTQSGLSNLDPTRRNERLNNQVYYRISAIKEVPFKVVYNGEQLYRDGEALVVKANVTMSAGFSYWDPANDCPPLKEDFEQKYRLGNPLPPHGFGKTWWQHGAIIDNNWNNVYPIYGSSNGDKYGLIGDSGMDFVLGQRVPLGSEEKTVALEIVKIIESETGERLHPAEKIISDFEIKYNPNGDSNIVKQLQVYPAPEELANLQDGHSWLRDCEIVVGQEGIAALYDFDVNPGMFFVNETPPSYDDIMTDTSGNEWVYQGTRVETEYVTRKTDYDGKRHVVDGCSAVPEFIGDHSEDGEVMHSGFLEFYFHNVYIKKPRKQEIDPYKGTGMLGPVNVGDEITYEISYQNYKDQPAVIHIKDKLGPNVEFVSATEGGALVGDTVKWDLQEVPAHKAGTVQLTVRVLESALVKENGEAGPGKVVNNGDTASVQVDDDHEYTLDTVENPVPGKAETAPYVGTGDLGAVQVGDEITYRISCQNYTENAATIIIKDTLDPNVELKSATNNVTPDGNRVLTWELADVPAGESRTVEITVKVLESARQPGEVVNTAKVKVGNEDEFDLEPVKNPVPEEPEKKEIGLNGETYTAESNSEYYGNGERGGVKVGDKLTYRIDFKNYKSVAADVVIIDNLDRNVKFVSAEAPEFTGADITRPTGEAGGTVKWTIENVAAGTAGYVTLTVEVLEGALKSHEPAGPGKVVNGGGKTASVKVGNDNEYYLDKVENPVPELPHKQETAPYEDNGPLGGVQVGDVITYEISYQNYKSAAADITIEDQLDPNVTFVSASNGGVCVNGVVTWTLKNVPAGREGTVTLKVEVLESALESNQGPGKVVNGGDTATVKVGNDAAFTLDEVENPVPEPPHKLEIGVNLHNPEVDEGDPDSNYYGDGVLGVVQVGDKITYEISYWNYKDQAATVTIVDKLDDHVTLVSTSDEDKVAHTGPDANGAGGTVTWTLDNVEPGQHTVRLTVEVLDSAQIDKNGPGMVVNGGNKDTWVQVGNDSRFSLEEVVNPVLPCKKETEPYEGLGVLGGVKVGDEITYRIDYVNYTNAQARIHITDKLDDNVEFVSATFDGAQVTNGSTGFRLSGQTAIWEKDNVNAGDKGYVTLTVTVLKSALESEDGPGKVVNGPGSTIQVSDEPVIELNTVENPVPEPKKKEIGLNIGADDEVSGEDTEYYGKGTLGGVQVGDEITYEISYRNYKDEAADVRITDQLDPHVEFVSASDNGQLVGNTVKWNLKDVAPSGNNPDPYVTLTVRVLASALKSNDPAGPGKVVNGGDTATVKVGNDHEYTLDKVENPVPEPPHKKETAPYEGTDVLGGVKVGDELTYRIDYRNYKTVKANVIVSDKLDEHVDFVSATLNGVAVAKTDVYDADKHAAVWTIENVEADKSGYVTLTVKVLESALESNKGPGKVVNGGKTATVKVGNDKAFTLETVENPVTDPHKKEIGLNIGGTDEISGKDSAYYGIDERGGVKVGDKLTYEISYKNYKNVAANVVIKDQLDANVKFVSAASPDFVDTAIGAPDEIVPSGGVVTWTLTDVPAGREGKVTLTVEVLEGALVSNGGPGKVVNGGDTATVKVGEDNEITLETVENPVPEVPHKQEFGRNLAADPAAGDKPAESDYSGNGVRGLVKVGDTLTYEISYRNYKSASATVKIVDKLDANVKYVRSSDSGSYTGTDADGNGGLVKWEIKDVAPGAEGKVYLTVEVLEGALKSKEGPGKVVNDGDTATVQVGNDQEYTLDTVENPVIGKRETDPYDGTGELGGVQVGDEITYTIDYVNDTNANAAVTITDKLGVNVAFVSATLNGVAVAKDDVYDADKHAAVWTIGNVDAGTAGYVTLTVKVLEGALKSNEGPGKVVNGGDTATVEVGNDHRYTLDKVENPVPEGPEKKEIGLNGETYTADSNSEYYGNGERGAVKVGDELTYRIDYRNYKTVAANVTVSDKLDKNVAFVSASDGGTNNAGVVNWTIENVGAGKAGYVTLTVEVLADALASHEPAGPGKVVNGGNSDTWVQVDNDGRYELEPVENPVPDEPHKQEIGLNLPSDDAEVDKTTDYYGNGVRGRVKVGDRLTYEISYKNYKGDKATVTIKDKLDPNVKFVSATDGGKNEDGTVVWTLENVEAGHSGTVRLTVEVLEGALKSKEGPGKVVNDGDTATVQVGNDQEYTLDTVENPVIEKRETDPYDGTGELGGVKVGDEITYTIDYVNDTDAEATVTITDTLDANVAFVSASNPGKHSGGENGGTVTWKLENVGAGTAGYVTLTVKVLEGARTEDAGYKVVNEGTKVKIGDAHEYTLEPVENPVPEEPEKKEIGLNGETYTAESNSEYYGNGERGGVKVGDELTYRIDFKNYKSVAADVVIKDTLDEHVEFVSATDGVKPVNGVVTWTKKNVAADEAGYVTLTVRVLASAQTKEAGYKVVNGGGKTASVQVGNDNEYYLNEVENPVPEEPEKKEIIPYEGTGVLGAVKVGDELTYEISYKNYKADPATIVIKDTLDDNVKFVSASSPDFDDATIVAPEKTVQSGGLVTWTLTAVPEGKEGKVRLTVEVLPSALVSNEGPGKVVNGGDTATVKVGNDSEFTLNTVENPIPEKKETAPYEGVGLLGNVKVGQEITYQIDYYNYKDATTTVVVKDKLDPNVKFKSASNGGAYDETTHTVTWTIQNAPVGAGSVTLTVEVLPGALVSNGGTGSVINGGDTASVKVGNDKEVTLNPVENPIPEKKEIDPYKGTGLLGFVKVGQEITYEIDYYNYMDAATTVVVKDKLDPNVKFKSASKDGAYDETTHTVTWTIKNAPVGTGSVTLTVEVLEGALVSNGGTGSVINGGDTASVKVGNDKEVTLNPVENPMPEKREIGLNGETYTAESNSEYYGNGERGGVKVGDELTYRIDYRNYKGVAADVVIKDTLDANVAFVSASDGGTNNAGVVNWTIKDVTAGATGYVTLTVRVLASAQTKEAGYKVVNGGGESASVQVGNDNEYYLNEVENHVPEEPEKKEIGLNGETYTAESNSEYYGNGERGGVKVGDEITYRISYRNYKSEAANVVIKDTLDEHVEFVSATDGVKPVEGVVTWTKENVAAGAEGYVELTVKVLETALVSKGGPGKVVNGGENATVKVGNDQEFTLEVVENPVPEEPEKKEIMPYEGVGVLGPVKVDDEITYEISYRNYKTEAADVVIRDTLDKNVAFVSASDGGANDAGIVNWTLKNVAAGKEGKVTLTVKVLPGALKSNGGPDKVVNGGGKSASVKVGNDDEYYLKEVENPVEEKPVPQKREIGPYVGTGVLGAVNVGDEITYEITYENYKAAAADIVIKDKLDANVAFVSASDGGVNAGGVVTWTLKDVPAGVDGAVTLTVKVLEGALMSNGGPGKVVNGGNTSSVKVGNDSEVTLNKVENPVPEIPVPEKKEIAPYEGTGLLGSVRVGDAITYEISYKNYKSEAADVVIKDKLDKNVEFVSASDGGVNDAGVVTWTFKAVPAGQTGKVTLTVKVLPGALVSQKGPGSVVNGGDTASVKVGNDDEYTLNPVENPVQEEPEKKEIMPYEGTGVLGGVKVGDAITYEITYRNYKQTAADVVIRDTLDKNVAFVSASDGGVNNAGIVTWTLKNVAAGKAGKVTLTVKVLPGALKSNGGPDKVINGGGKTASVKVGNDDEYYLNEVENPVEEPKPVQTEPPKLTPTATPTPKPTATATPTPKPTATATPTPKPTATPTPTPKNNGGGTTTATPTPVPPHDINGRKVWIDENDAHGTRPESITVTLYANGEPLDVEPTWNSTEGNNWSFTFTRMPTVDENGQTINYTVKETPVKYYEATVNGFTITNRLEAPKPERYVTLQGTKTWSDDENALGIRPNVITVRLFRDGVEFDKRDVTAATGWKYDFGTLPADDGYGNIYVYKLDEDPVQGYFKRIDGMNLTNKPLAIKTTGADDDSIYLAKQARLEVLSRRTGTKRPRYEDYTDEELAELFDLFGYGTPLWGALLPTGDETPVYPFIFGGLGTLILLALAVTRKKRRTE